MHSAGICGFHSEAIGQCAYAKAARLRFSNARKPVNFNAQKRVNFEMVLQTSARSLVSWFTLKQFDEGVS